MKPLLVEGEVPVTQVLLRRRRLVERDEEQIELLAVCELDPSVIVAKVPFPGTMIESCAQLDAEVPCVQHQRYLGREGVLRGQHRVQLAQDRHQTCDLFAQ